MPAPGDTQISEFDEFFTKHHDTTSTYAAHIPVEVPDGRQLQSNLLQDGNVENYPEGSIVGAPKYYDKTEELTSALKVVDGGGAVIPPVIFVHGYHFSFSDAVKAGAYLQSEFERGKVLVFSWPADILQEQSLDNYRRAEAEEAAIKADFLTGLAAIVRQDLGVRPNIVAHSLGVRLVFDSYRHLLDESLDDRMNLSSLNHVILVAGDVSTTQMVKDYPAITNQFVRNTDAYCARFDAALWLSLALNKLESRLGLCPASITPIENVRMTRVEYDGNDASGHLYLLLSPKMVEDVKKILKQNGNVTYAHPVPRDLPLR